MIKLPFSGNVSLSQLLAGFLLTVSLVCWGDSLWIKGKAVAAQVLIKGAWQTTLESGNMTKPWSWADTWPVASIHFPSRNEILFALAGSHGTSLAFGPGHMDGTALPGEPGTQVFSGHRDTHFAFLQHVSMGEIFRIQQPNGRWQHYRVADIRVVEARREPLIISPDSDEVRLITCYPFNSILPDPTERFIVTGLPVPPAPKNGSLLTRQRM